jgi:biopolymer transport protein ExbD
MRLKKRDNNQEVNTGSMADIAFLLLIFFLVAATLKQEKGLSLRLPPEKKDKPIDVPKKEISSRL